MHHVVIVINSHMVYNSNLSEFKFKLTAQCNSNGEGSRLSGFSLNCFVWVIDVLIAVWTLQAGRMDVVWGETAGVTGQLWVLYPLLFILQVVIYLVSRL